jgi:hypothetical protein
MRTLLVAAAMAIASQPTLAADAKNRPGLYTDGPIVKEFPEMETGICGPASAMHKQVENAGFRFEFTMATTVAPRVARMTYLAVPERAGAKRVKDAGMGGVDSWLEMVVMLDYPSSPKHKKGWRCINEVTSMDPKSRRELTKYLNEISRVLD